ncbi:MAG: S9 family peptidase [Steroidobacteraceae bacterium]
MKSNRLVLLLCLLALQARAADNLFGIDDLLRLADVAEPAFSPDGEYLAYSVTTNDLVRDVPSSDLWRVRWDGSDRRELTRTPGVDEWQPAWSPDGKWIAFLSDRGGDDATTQVWVMPAASGEAEKLTDFPGGVLDYAWAPDSRQLAIIARDPKRPAGEPEPPQPPPIVITRYQFKEDDIGLLTERRQRLYLFEVEERKATPLTPGTYEEYLPSWSPDGKQIAYVTKRGGDPDRNRNWDIYLVEPRTGANERRLTSFPGSDLDPYWESRPEWSPDSRRVAYLQGGEDRLHEYGIIQLAVIDVATGGTALPAQIDRNFSKPRFSADGKSVLALIEHDRTTWLSRIELGNGKITPLTRGPRFDADYTLAANGRIAVLGGDDRHPYELAAIERHGLRTLADHNDFLRGKQLAAVESIDFDSADGTRVGGFLVKPIGYEPGRRYPTILRIHGGPIYQFSHEFMEDWQVYAANGYAVVAANPRGSSGRGFDFSHAIYADWGNKDVIDVRAAVDYLIARGVADPDRLVIGGRSYGGMLTNYVIARDTRFKAAVSGAGSSNAIAMYGADQYTRESEYELGKPWVDRTAWDHVSDPFLHADRIKTPTLFYCEELDVNVPCIGSEQMYQALRSLEVPTELVIYPGEWHPITVPSYLRDRMQRHLDWYGRYLAKRP